MKSILKSVLAVAALLFAATAMAEEPIITFKTSLYELNGAMNSFTFSIGGTGGGYIDVDFGYGPEEYELSEAVFDSTTQQITATSISGTVSPEGIVKIYGNASVIDFLNLEGCYVRTLQMPTLTNLTILNLQHNELTGLDLTPFSKLQAVYLSDNPYSAATPLVVGPNKPDLTILEIGTSEYLDQTFDISDYPNLMSFDAYGARDLRHIDPSGCPKLLQLSLDVTQVETIDVTHNPELLILNISDTKITSIDLSKNTKLQQFYCARGGYDYVNYKIKKLDLTHNPELFYFFAGYNALTELDLSKNTKLLDMSLPYNELKSLDLSANKNLYNVNISFNYFSFATLPTPGEWNEYYYEQRPFPIDRSYKVGQEIDFSQSMLREGTQTVAALYKVNEDDFSMPIPVDPSAYKFENGKFTVLTEFADSVFVRFDNSLFSDAPINTSNFVVKKAEDFGKPSQAVNFLPALNDGDALSFKVGVANATPSSARTFFVDLGDGNMVEFAATGATLADATEVKTQRKGYGYVAIYMPEGNDLTALAIDGIELYSADFTKARHLKQLHLLGTGLYQIELESLRCLTDIYFKGNHFNTLNLNGKNRYFTKTVLSDLRVPDNGIATLEIEGFESLYNIDASNNQLEEFLFATAIQAHTINVSGNKLTAADLNKCEALVSADLSHNSISTITLPYESVLANLALDHNAMTIATLPEPSLIPGTYTYGDQQPVEIPSLGPTADLSSQYRVIDGKATQYVWNKADGTALVKGKQYTEEQGQTRFLDSNVGKVYCVMTNAGLPGLSLRSTEIEVAPMPTFVVASFTTPVGGEKVSLSLAAEKVATIYIDWKGNGTDFVNYMLGTTYTIFEAQTYEGANVKVYTYEDTPISVFSITGATMTKLDIKNLTSAKAITLSKAGLTSIELPDNGVITELALDNNKLTAIDLSKQPNLYTLALSNNNLSGSFDLSPFKQLELAALAGNNLSSVKLDNSLLWFLDVSYNDLSEIDFSKVPDLQQLSVAGNKFHNIDVDGLHNLRALIVDQNYFTFTTLPEVKPQYILYTYGNQARLKPIVDKAKLTVDLSSQASVDGTATTYDWFIDDPVQDEEGNWVGEQLVADEEYTVADGVTTFEKPLAHLVCLMRNSKFPNAVLFSEMVDFMGSVENVAADNAATVAVSGRDLIVNTSASADVTVYTIDGRLVRHARVDGIATLESFDPAIYIVRIGKQSFKVAVR